MHATAIAAPTLPHIQRFEIVRLLGSGGMGNVYEAIDRESRTRVALKTLRTLTTDLRLRFKNEFRALQDIHHPNLLRLGELFDEDGQLYFTMDLVTGTPFLAYVRPAAEALAQPMHSTVQRAGAAPPEPAQEPDLSRPLFDEARLRASLAQLAAGLDALHAAHRVHRDVKSSNILITAEGRLVILDFGLILDTAHAGEERGIVGTAHFMAPEQAAGDAVGPAADWYSVGVLLYTALTGDLPFRATGQRVMALKRRFEPQPPGRFVQGLPRDLADLCVGLLRRDPRARLSGAEVLRSIGAGEEPAPSSRLSTTGRFVGRGPELRALAEAFERVRAGEPAAVVVEAESGMGKSALVRHFLQSIPHHEALVLNGRCYERDSVPYKALDEVIGALGRHLAALPIAELSALLPEEHWPLVCIFPDLSEGIARRSEPERAPDRDRNTLDPLVLRSRAFAALRELLRRLAEQRPLVIGIDDIQWTDSESMALLAEVMRPPEAPRLLLVVTRRTASEAPTTAPPHDLFAPLGAAHHIALGSLPPEEAQALVGALLQRPIPAADVAAVAAEAQGHPLFIDALVQHRAARDGGARPVRLDDALGARVERLDLWPRRLLELVSVAGTPIHLESAAHATTAGIDEIARLIIPLQAARLLRLTRSGRDQMLEPYHDRIRAAVLRRLDANEKRTWHGRLALALEASGRAELETLAIHWKESGDLERAAAYGVRAGDEAARVLAFARAARLYRTALEQSSGTGGEAALHALRVKLAEALAHAGRGAEAAEVYLRAARSAPAPEALRLQARSAQCYLHAGYIEEGIACYREVLAAADLEMPGSAPAALAKMLYLRARLAIRGFGFKERPARDIDPKVLERIDTCWGAGAALTLVDPLRGAALVITHMLLSLDVGEPSRVALALANEGSTVAHLGPTKNEPAEKLFEQATALAAKNPSPSLDAYVFFSKGVALFSKGRYRASVAELMRADAIYREHRIEGAWERDIGRIVTLNNLWFLGEAHELVRLTPIFLRDARERGNRYLVTSLSTGYPNARLLIEDRPDEAIVETESAMEGWSNEGLHYHHIYALQAFTQHGLYTGDGERARRYARRIGAAIDRSLFMWVPIVSISVRHARARLALLSARTDRALAGQASRDARAIERTGERWAAPYAALIRAGVASCKGDLDLGLTLLIKATRGFEATEQALYAAAARRRWGEIMGGEEGRALVQASTRWMTEQGVVSPDRMTATLAPGFGD